VATQLRQLSVSDRLCIIRWDNPPQLRNQQCQLVDKCRRCHAPQISHPDLKVLDCGKNRGARLLGWIVAFSETLHSYRNGNW
jgi:hypothetical protein